MLQKSFQLAKKTTHESNVANIQWKVFQMMGPRELKRQRRECESPQKYSDRKQAQSGVWIDNVDIDVQQLID